MSTTEIAQMLRSEKLKLFEALWALIQHRRRGPEDAFDYLGHSNRVFDSLLKEQREERSLVGWD